MTGEKEIEFKSLLFDWHLSVSKSINTIKGFIDKNNLANFNNYQAEISCCFQQWDFHARQYNMNSYWANYYHGLAFNELRLIDDIRIHLTSLALLLFPDKLQDLNNAFNRIDFLLNYPIDINLTIRQLDEAYLCFTNELKMMLEGSLIKKRRDQ